MSCLYGQEAFRAIRAAGTLDAISSEEIDRMLLHADECPACSAELRVFAAGATLAQSPPVRLEPARAARLRARVITRVTDGRSFPGRRARVVRTGWTRYARASGWLAAATLSVVLLAHHGFHEPLSSGWLVAAGFAAVALGLGIYAQSQKRRATELEHQMRSRQPAQADDLPTL